MLVKHKKNASQRRLMRLQRIGFQNQAHFLRKDYSNKNKFNEINHNKKSQKRIMTQEKQKKKGNFLQATKIISVSAHKWAIYDFYSCKYLRGYRAHDSHQLSIFSKLLVFCTVNTLLIKYELDLDRFETIVTYGALKNYSQPCRLQVDDIVSLFDLIHLMIMEQSEAYEMILALNLGAYLEKKHHKSYYSIYDVKDQNMNQHLQYFYNLVNTYTKMIKLQNFNYVQFIPEQRKHHNKCCAVDLAVLAGQCLKIPMFKKIIQLQKHTYSIKYLNSQAILRVKEDILYSKTISNPYLSYVNVARNWSQNQFMSSHSIIYYEDHENPKILPIIAVLLSSYNPGDREKDIQQLVEWYIKSKLDNKNSLQLAPLKKNSSGIQKIINSIDNQQLVMMKLKKNYHHINNILKTQL